MYGAGSPNEDDAINGQDDVDDIIVTPVKKDSFYYDTKNQVCYRSLTTAGAGADWQVYSAPGEVKLSWSALRSTARAPFPSIGCIVGQAGENFDYDNHINRDTLSNSVLEFTDNAKNSFFAPVPNTVYFYEVRPIINGIPTDTDDSFKKVRVLVPDNNRAFAHRWIINKACVA